MLPLGDADGADEAGLARLPALGAAIDVYSPAGTPLRGGRRARLHQGLAGHDTWDLGRRGALPRDLLAPLPRRLDARRLGVDRRGRLLVPARPLDDTLNIAGKRIGPAELESAALEHPSVAEAAAIGIPHEVKGETAWIYCALKPEAEADADAIQARRSRRWARRSRRSGCCSFCAAEDALGEDRPPRRTREGARRGPGRPLDARKPRRPGGDRMSRALVTGGERGIGADIAWSSRRPAGT